MPYIDQNTRAELAPLLNPLLCAMRRLSEGGLNYVITRLVIQWLGPRPNYTRFNAVVGTLGCAQLELYRRMVAPYEDAKRYDNGDVYPPLSVNPNGGSLRP